MRLLHSSVVALAGLGLAISAFSTYTYADHEKQNQEVVVLHGDHDQDTHQVHINTGGKAYAYRVDGNAMDVSEIGELIGADPKNVEITMSEGGLNIRADGKTVSLSFEGLTSLENLSQLKELKALKSLGLMPDSDAKAFALSMEVDTDDQVLVSGLEDLDSAQKQAIIDGFRAAGIDQEISFGNPQEKRLVIKKEIEEDAQGSKTIVIKMQAGEGEPKIIKKIIER